MGGLLWRRPWLGFTKNKNRLLWTNGKTLAKKFTQPINLSGFILTRIAGTNIVKAPCYGALYSTTAFASINFMASEHWTDGQDENSLSQFGWGLRSCTCGSYFRSGYA